MQFSEKQLSDDDLSKSVGAYEVCLIHYLGLEYFIEKHV